MYARICTKRTLVMRHFASTERGLMGRLTHDARFVIRIFGGVCDMRTSMGFNMPHHCAAPYGAGRLENPKGV